MVTLHLYNKYSKHNHEKLNNMIYSSNYSSIRSRKQYYEKENQEEKKDVMIHLALLLEVYIIGEKRGPYLTLPCLALVFDV